MAIVKPLLIRLYNLSGSIMLLLLLHVKHEIKCKTKLLGVHIFKGRQLHLELSRGKLSIRLMQIDYHTGEITNECLTNFIFVIYFHQLKDTVEFCYNLNVCNYI